MQATERRPLFVEASDQRIAFAAIVLTVGVVRAVVFAIGGGPATVDAGNWIAFGDDLLGADQRSSSLAYPPLIPIVTTLATRWFGVVVGVAVNGHRSVSSAIQNNRNEINTDLVGIVDSICACTAN